MQSIDIRYVNKFTGYKNFRDVTNLAVTDITAGSRNVFVEDGAKLSVRGGSRYFGDEGTVGTNTDPSWALAHRIHSDYDKFINNQGSIMPFRVFYSGNTTKGDVLEVWLPEFIAGVPQSTKRWYQVTPNVPTDPILSTHKWYWAEWYDPLNSQNRVVFTYGRNVIGSYTGGYAPIVSLTPTTLTTNGTWESKGYIMSPEGVNSVVINGVVYALTAGDFSTNTITVGATAGVSVNDVAFQSINFDTLPAGFIGDVCATINNQVYYIDWNQRNVFVSWNRNRNAELGTVAYQGTSGLDDAVFTGTYTGTSTDVYKVIITEINPETNTQTYQGTGTPISFNTSAYVGAGSNIYEAKCMATQVLTGKSATYTGTFVDGEIVVGGTSGAFGIIYDNDPITINLVAGLHTLQGQFEINETITGMSSGATIEIFALQESTWLTFWKNGVQLTGLTWFGGEVRDAYQITLNTQPIAASITLVDGLTIDFPTNMSMDYGDVATLTIETGDVDKFQYSINGVTQPGTFDVDTSPTSLGNGISVEWVKTTGHAVGDSWTITAYQKIIKGWREFSYSVPTRLPGEGFKIQLDSNGWSMKPQEKQMNIGGVAGEYYVVQSELSSDLKSEILSVQRLKTEQQNRALYPYLMESTKNYLSIVSVERSWDILGRQKFLELPQTKTLSDQVRVDFESADWEDATIRYGKRKTYFVIPREGLVLVYDEFMKYWHAPMSFGRRLASIAFIDDTIVGHSYERNESYEIFTSDRNDLDVYPLDTKIITPYYDYGKRFGVKEMTAFACDGYMEGNPQVKWKINCGVGGCDGIQEGEINPLVCVPTDTASLGKSALGFHGLGNSPTDVINYFKYGRTFGGLKYYLRNVEITCDQPDQRWSIVSYGNNVEFNKLSNADMFNK